jgi:hypothetical protein
LGGTQMISSDQEPQNLLLKIVHCNEFQAYIDGKPSACKKILDVQKKLLKPGDPLFTPTPWCGHIAKVPLLFISSNPSVDPDEFSPTALWPDIKTIDFFENRFSADRCWTKGKTKYLLKSIDKESKKYSSSQKYWSEMLGWAKDAYSTIGKHDFQPGIDYALTEIVHCGSKKNRGVNAVKQTCTNNYMELVLKLSKASVLVIVGKIANAMFEELFHSGLTGPMSKAQNSCKIAELNIGGLERLAVALPAPGANRERKFFSHYFSDYERQMISSFLNGKG